MRTTWVTLVGISLFWLPLSMISDGLTTLVLPLRVASYSGPSDRASVFGVVSFVGIVAGMLVQPVAGRTSDQLRHRFGRRATIALGVAIAVPALWLVVSIEGLLPLLLAFVLVQIGANVAQAGQQGFIPDLVSRGLRGFASGLKGSMDLAGALIGFIVLGSLLIGGDARPAAMALTAMLIGALLLTATLVREPALAATPLVSRGPLDAFRFDFREHRAFALLVGSRFLFLLGTYMVGRFLLFFIAERLELEPGDATESAGGVLAGLALLTALTAPAAGWAADRWGRIPLMVIGAATSAAGVLLLTAASTLAQIFVCGALMALGSGAFAAANWAFSTELAPSEEAARYMGLANIGTAGAAATAGLAGLLIDWGNALQAGLGYAALFICAAVSFGASALVLRSVAEPTREAPLIGEPAA